MAAPSQIKAWVSRATPPRADTGWYGMCAGLTDRVIAAFTDRNRQGYDSATEARLASGELNRDPALCPPGGIHFWSYYGTAWDGSRGNWGHVTIDIYGGGTDTLSATSYAHEWWGLYAGLISVASQSSRAGMKYLGWARRYGAATPLTITTKSTASGDSQHPFEEDDLDAQQAADLAQAAKDIGIVKQLLVETQQWKGIGQLVSETYTTVGIIKQLISETEQWTGMDTRLTQVLAAVRDLAAAAANDAAKDAALAAALDQLKQSGNATVDPERLAAILTDAAKSGATSALTGINFPTADAVAQQVISQQERTKLAALEAEVERLRGQLNQAQTTAG